MGSGEDQAGICEFSLAGAVMGERATIPPVETTSSSNLSGFRSLLTRNDGDRRVSDKQILLGEIAAWEQERNAHHTKSNWHFTTKYARIRLKHL